jgi:hypothetical protein
VLRRTLRLYSTTIFASVPKMPTASAGVGAEAAGAGADVLAFSFSRGIDDS